MPTDVTLVFVGTGVSTAIPVMGHLNKECACTDAIANPSGPNKRNNVSALLRVSQQQPDSKESSESSPAVKDVLIDCGKTFRDAYFHVMAALGVTQIDALLLTHDHMDAIGGLDDLRDLQPFAMAGDFWRCEHYVPTFMSKKTRGTLERQIPYVVNESKDWGMAAKDAAEFAKKPHPPVRNDGIRERRATCLSMFELPDDAITPFYCPELGDIPAYSLPVIHGEGYMCLGYAFGQGLKDPDAGQAVVYLSDVSRVPDDVMAFLKSIPRIDLLVIDVLQLRPHFSHYNLDQAWDLVRELDPVKAFGVGMFCVLEHNETNASLSTRVKAAKRDGKVSRLESFKLAFDGLELPLSL